MQELEELDVKSNIMLAALNVALLVILYFFVLFAGHVYLETVYDISIFAMVADSLEAASVPAVVDIVRFLETLLESLIVDSVVVGLIYAAYLSNHHLRVKGSDVEWQEGFLLVEKKKFKLEDIEQIYTQKYSFFKKTKALCIKALNEDVIKVPYVAGADKVKEKLVKMVKERYAELDAEQVLQEPIEVPA